MKKAPIILTDAYVTISFLFNLLYKLKFDLPIFLKSHVELLFHLPRYASVNSDINFNFLLINGRIQLGTVPDALCGLLHIPYSFRDNDRLSGKDSDLCLYTPYEIPLQILLAVSAPRHGFPYEILPLHPVLSGSFNLHVIIAPPFQLFLIF